MKNILVIGAGRVGLSTAAIMALHNPQLHVALVDKDIHRIIDIREDIFVRSQASKYISNMPGMRYLLQILTAGASQVMIVANNETPPIVIHGAKHDTNLQIELCPNDKTPIASQRIFEMIIIKTDMVIIATDSDSVEKAISDIICRLKSDVILVIRSTLTISQFTDIRQLVMRKRNRSNIEILINPEFLSGDSALLDQLYPNRVVIGASNTISGQTAAKKLASLYQKWVLKPEETIQFTDPESAQLIKDGSNAALVLQITMANVISAFCDNIGANIESVMRGIITDPRIGTSYFRPGPGYGGVCLPDSIARLLGLSEDLELNNVSKIWKSVAEFNSSKLQRTGQLLANFLGVAEDDEPLTVTILGYAYKTGVADHRGSLVPSIVRSLLKQLQTNSSQLGTLKIFDPLCNQYEVVNQMKQIPGITHVYVYDDPKEACLRANVVLLLNDHSSLINHHPDKLDQKEMNIIRFLAKSELRAKNIRLDDRIPDGSLDEWILGRIRSQDFRAECNIPQGQTDRSWRLQILGVVPNPEEAYNGIDWKEIAGILRAPKIVLDCVEVGCESNELAKATEFGIRVERLSKKRG